MNKYSIYLNILFFINIFINISIDIYCMKATYNDSSHDCVDFDIIRNNIKNRVSNGNIFTILKDIQEFIKIDILKKYNFGIHQSKIEQNLMNFAVNYIKSYFAYNYLNTKQCDRNIRFKQILEGVYNSDLEIEAAKLIISGIDHNLHIMLKNGSTASPLIFMLSKNKFMKLFYLMMFYDININIKNDLDYNFFLWSLKNKNYPVLNLLLQNINSKINNYNANGRTMLMHAIISNDLIISEMILDRFSNLDVDIQDIYGYTALKYAIYLKMPKNIIIKILKHSKLIVNIQNSNNGSDIMYLDPKNNNRISILRVDN